MNWTKELVKEHLPDIPVKLPNGEVIQARVTGRKNSMATVTVDYMRSKARHLKDFRADGIPWADCHYSWEVLANALNSKAQLVPW